MTRSLSLDERGLQSRHAVDLISDKWRIGILHLLTPGPLRTGELQRGLEEVSPKMLTQTLRGLERDGLVRRHVRRAVPPQVEYELTPMGKSLLKPLRELCLWAKAHVAARDAARRTYDSASAE